jgi:hypothetical protein
LHTATGEQNSGKESSDSTEARLTIVAAAQERSLWAAPARMSRQTVRFAGTAA